MNLSEILHKRAIKSAILHQTTFRHCAAADWLYFYQLNRTRLAENVNLTSFSKLPEIPLQSTKLILMSLLSTDRTWGLGIHRLCDLLSLRTCKHYVTIQRLNVSGF